MRIPSLVPMTFLLVAAGLPAATKPPEQPFGPKLADFVQTSAAGDHFKALPPVHFRKGTASGVVVTVTPSRVVTKTVICPGADVESEPTSVA